MIELLHGVVRSGANYRIKIKGGFKMTKLKLVRPVCPLCNEYLYIKKHLGSYMWMCECNNKKFIEASKIYELDLELDEIDE